MEGKIGSVAKHARLVTVSGITSEEIADAFCEVFFGRESAQHGVQPTDTAAACGGDSDQSSSRANVGG